MSYKVESAGKFGKVANHWYGNYARFFVGAGAAPCPYQSAPSSAAH